MAESEFGVITPRPALAATGTLKLDAAKISATFANEGADRAVIGVPLEEDGTKGKMARICMKVAELLREQGIEVAEIDERYSSVEAESNLMQEDLKASQRRKLRDGEAASIILRRYLEELEKA